MDDFTYFGETFEEALKNLDLVLKRCKDTDLSLKHEKCHLMMIDGIVLGHHVSTTGLKVDPKKIEVIQKLSSLKKVKAIRSFLGHARYYRRFVKEFGKIASPLYDLICKDNEFTWIDACQLAFDSFKISLTTTPMLKGLDWKLPFHVYTNASDTTIGGVLGQKANKNYHPIHYISKCLRGAELNYIVTKKGVLVSHICHK